MRRANHGDRAQDRTHRAASSSRSLAPACPKTLRPAKAPWGGGNLAYACADVYVVGFGFSPRAEPLQQFVDVLLGLIMAVIGALQGAPRRA